jgi:nucleoside-diphosphate-sugar epimerase
VSIAIVTGSGGLVGSETARLFLDKGLDVAGVDNDMRGTFFGPEASTRWQVDLLASQQGYTHHAADIRDAPVIDKIFARYQPVGLNTARRNCLESGTLIRFLSDTVPLPNEQLPPR